MIRRLLIITLATFWTIASAIEGHSLTPEQKIQTQHQKLWELLADLVEIERDLSNHLGELTAADQGVDFSNIYQGINISTIEGIRIARQRASIFGTQMATFGALLEDSWARIAEKVNANDLDEPLATELKSELSLDERDIYPRTRKWILAAREEVTAVNHYLDVHEHYLGQFKWGDNSLSFTDPRVPSEIAKAQAALIATEDRYNLAAGAASGKHGNTIKFVLSAMHKLEKGMIPREGTDSEQKPQ